MKKRLSTISQLRLSSQTKINLCCSVLSSLIRQPPFHSFFRYKIGEAFVHLSHSRAMKRLEKDQTDIDGKVAGLAAQADECEIEMKQLKVVLYAKFGKAINLDE